MGPARDRCSSADMQSFISLRQDHMLNVSVVYFLRMEDHQNLERHEHANIAVSPRPHRDLRSILRFLAFQPWVFQLRSDLSIQWCLGTRMKLCHDPLKGTKLRFSASFARPDDEWLDFTATFGRSQIDTYHEWWWIGKAVKQRSGDWIPECHPKVKTKEE